MKRKIAILLAAVMTSAMIPMTALANSNNTVNKSVTVKDDDAIEGLFVKIIPENAVTSNSSIVISLENGEFSQDRINGEDKNFDEEYKYDAAGMSFEQALTAYNSTTGDRNKVVAMLGGKGADAKPQTDRLPYQIRYMNKKEIEVKLAPMPESQVNKDLSSEYGKPNYFIPILATAKGTGDIKVIIDSTDTSISNKTITVGTSTSASGDTVSTIDGIKSFEDIGELETITVKESSKGTLKPGETVTLRLSGGFNFVPGSFGEGNKKFPRVISGIGMTSWEVKDDDLKIKDDELKFDLPGMLDSTNSKNEFKTTKPGTFKIENLRIESDSDDDWGDVNITISGAGISRETIKVATRSDFGFKMTATEDPKTLVAGRMSDDIPGAKGPGTINQINKDDMVAAEIKFEETIPNTWIKQRKLEFKVPEGVKIVSYEYSNEKNFDQKPEEKSSLVDSGKTLRIEKGLTDKHDADNEEFKLKLWLSIDADYTGEVPLSVEGGGVAAGVIDDVVIANVISPVTIESKNTKSNLGYQNVDTADIVITENLVGGFIKNGSVKVELDSVYGSKELGFADENIDYEVSGQLQVKNFKVSNGIISFTVDKESYNEPASVTIKNVKVGSTRSVPYGSYDFTVYGDGIINNYKEDAAGGDNEGKNDTLKDDAGFFDTTEKYKFKDYITIVTATTTLDNVVKVTIGEKTILIDNESQEMDVAPYIQSTSNSTMVPLRFVSVALGVDNANVANPDESSKVSFDPNTKTATIYYGAGTSQKIIQFTAGSNIMKVDGSEIPMEYGVVAEIKDERMFVPFRALGTALGVNVAWDADTRTATYNAQ